MRTPTIIAIIALASIGSASAAPPTTVPSKNPLTCFYVNSVEPYRITEPDACTTDGRTATLDTNFGRAGVHLRNFNSSFYGVRLPLVKTLSNTVSGDPFAYYNIYWAIPIDDPASDEGGVHDGRTDYYIYAIFENCNNGTGLVDVISDATCSLDWGDGLYPNWAAVVRAHPNLYIATDVPARIFADPGPATGVWTVSNVQVGKPGR